MWVSLSLSTLFIYLPLPLSQTEEEEEKEKEVEEETEEEEEELEETEEVDKKKKKVTILHLAVAIRRGSKHNLFAPGLPVISRHRGYRFSYRRRIPELEYLTMKAESQAGIAIPLVFAAKQMCNPGQQVSSPFPCYEDYCSSAPVQSRSTGHCRSSGANVPY